MKKLFTLLFTAALAFSLAMPVLAQDTTTTAPTKAEKKEKKAKHMKAKKEKKEKKEKKAAEETK